jgi:predicted acetyltransferase
VAPGLSAADLVRELDFSRTRGVEVGPGHGDAGAGDLVAMYAHWLMALTVPGPAGTLRRLPMSGLTWVAVHPDRRRQGVLTRMMTDHLHGLHESGEAAVAGLHASETGIYGRFGYGTASLDVLLTLGRGTTFRTPEAVGQAADTVVTELRTADDDAVAAALHEIHLRSAEHVLGTVTRGDDIARVWFTDHPTARGEKEPWRVLLARREGELVGYAVLRRTAKWSDAGHPEGEVAVRELSAVDAPALLALARRLVDFDLTATVKIWSRSTDDPLVWWAGGPRPVSMRGSDALWVRLVDVDRALEARGYGAPCDVVLDVADTTCPWNARRWRLRVDTDGVGRCTPSDDPADLELDVSVLGAAYLGGRSVAGQAAAGLVTELRPGSLLALSRAMRADLEPLGAIGF